MTRQQAVKHPLAQTSVTAVPSGERMRKGSPGRVAARSTTAPVPID